MLRRLLVLGLVVTLVSTLAAVAALRTSTDDADAQAIAYEMDYLCLSYYTGIYSGSFSPNCGPGAQLLVLPDDYPVTLCASYYTGALYRPQASGTCAPSTLRIDLPTEFQVNICYNYWTGALRLANPYPTGSCGPYGLLVGFPFGIGEDIYQTLGNVDIDVPESDGILTNDVGPGLTVSSCDTMSANGGGVNVNADGSFTYIPPAPAPNAFTGADTFDCTVTGSNGLTENVSVDVEVLNPVVWFVDADATDPGDGRRQTPLNDLQVLNDDGNDPDNPGDFIYLFEATAQYSGGFVLENSQTLVGQEVSIADVLTSELGVTSTLQGTRATMIPPFVVLPDTNPTPDIPFLTNEFAGLQMVDGTTATGVTITSELGRGVSASGANELLLDTVIVTGGVEGIGLPGVEIFESDMQIVDSEIYGGDGIAPSDISGGSSLQGLEIFGPDGGDAIFAIDSTLLVSGTLADGGDGADGVQLGGRGGDGIEGDFALNPMGSSLQGLIGDSAEIIIIDSEISGGQGGDGIGPPEGIGQSSILLGDPSPAFGEIGGSGISVFNGLTPLGQSVPTLQGPVGTSEVEAHVSNSQVTGGDGGNGVDGGAGGGRGIESRGVHLTVDQGSTVNGGTGGDTLIGSSGSGGGGISTSAAVETNVPIVRSATLQGPGTPMVGSLAVADSTIIGGPAGTSPGNPLASGGAGIIGNALVEITGIESGSTLTGGGAGLHPITITNSIVSGADGVDNLGGGGLAGGPGIIGDFVDLLVQSGSVINGGDGGDGQSGAEGADGIDIFSSTATVNASTVNGGAGGLSNDDVGPDGGIGIATSNCAICFTLTVSGSSINGGDGGGALSMGAGLGGTGISVDNDSLNVSTSTVTGGEPGADGSGRGGPAGTPAIRMSYEDPGSFIAIMSNNGLIGSAGDPGQAPSLIITVSTGTVCVDATGNTPTGLFEMINSDGLAITQANDPALSADNNNVTVNLTNVGYNCSTAP